MGEGGILIERDPAMKTVAVQDDLIVTNLALCKCFALNGSASAVWRTLETPHSAEQICAALLEKFDVSAEQCREEIDALIETWSKLGLVRAIA